RGAGGSRAHAQPKADGDVSDDTMRPVSVGALELRGDATPATTTQRSHVPFGRDDGIERARTYEMSVRPPAVAAPFPHVARSILTAERTGARRVETCVARSSAVPILGEMRVPLIRFLVAPGIGPILGTSSGQLPFCLRGQRP